VSGVTAVLTATAGAGEGSAAAQPWAAHTLVRRLVEQLGSLGIDSVHVITRPEWEPEIVAALDGLAMPVAVVPSPDAATDLRAVAAIAHSGSGRLIVAYADILTHREALAGLLADPRVPTGILAAFDVVDAPGAWRIRTNRGRVESAASPFHTVHQPTNTFLGVIKVDGAHRPALARVAGQLAELGLADDVPSLLLVGLVRADVQLAQSMLRELFWSRPLSTADLAEARERIGTYDEDRVLLDSAVKATDGFFTTFFVSPYSKYIARWAARRGFTPNQITTVSLLIGAAAAAAFASGERAGYVAGAILLQAAFTFDCVDGQLARYTRTFTKLGAWLDSIFDRSKEYLVFAGLAIGAERAGHPVWVLAGAALTLQTVRHMFDFSFAAMEHQAIAAAPQRPVEDRWDGSGPKPGAAAEAGATPARRVAPPRPSLPARTLASWRRLNRLPGMAWFKRVLAFPIGERFAAISITAALFSPRTTFIVLIAWGGVAATYSLAGRLLRSMR
jgi:phosphatidylglycerophosphate synthase